jgi:hypothetical protein
MHDWSKVKPGTYHNFHQLWTSSITNQINSGILPRGCFAMAEQIIGVPEPDVVALKLNDNPIETPDGNGQKNLVLAEMVSHWQNRNSNQQPAW